MIPMPTQKDIRKACAAARGNAAREVGIDDAAQYAQYTVEYYDGAYFLRGEGFGRISDCYYSVTAVFAAFKRIDAERKARILATLSS